MTPTNESGLNALTAGERRRLFFATVGLASVTFVTGIIIVLLAIPQLPDSIATHWGVSLDADGFGSPWVSFWLLLATGALLVGVIYFSAYQQAGTRPTLGSSRQFVGFLTGVSGFICTLVVASTTTQVGLSEAQVRELSIAPSMLLALAVGVGIGTIAGFVAPTIESVPVEAEPVHANADGTDEFGEWKRSVTAPTLIWWVMIGAIALLVAISVVIVIFEPSIWFVALLPAVLVYPIISCITWHVTVSSDGLTARSILGWPVIRIPAESIERVELTSVEPMAEFGGWGLRFGVDRRWGIILQKGEAIQIRRNDGKRTFLVTVDDAATGAAILSSFASSPRS